MALETYPLDIAELLENEDDIVGFLNACAEELPRDPTFLVRCLGTAARAHRNMSQLARAPACRAKVSTSRCRKPATRASRRYSRWSTPSGSGWPSCRCPRRKSPPRPSPPRRRPRPRQNALRRKRRVDASPLHAHHLPQRVHDLDQVGLRRHHRVDRLVRRRRSRRSRPRPCGTRRARWPRGAASA